jgi:WD40 repeat protein
VSFSPDGKRLACAGGGEVKFWDVQTGQELFALPVSATPYSVAFSPDGHRLAVTSDKGTVTIWDATPLPAQP